MFQQARARRSGSASVHVGNAESWIEGDTPTEALRETLSYQNATVARFLRTGKWGHSQATERDLRDAYAKELIFGRRAGEINAAARKVANTVYLYDAASQRFPTTLLRDVLRVMRGQGIRYTIVDHREAPEPTVKLKYNHNGHEPRLYQDRAIDVGAFCRYGTFAMATNAGKTSVMLRLIERRGYKTLILVQRQELMFQIAEAIHRHLNYVPGMAGASQFKLRDITVAIVNTAHQRIQEMVDYGFDMVFVDEGHHAASRIHFTVLEKLKAYAVYSMTGTDFRNSRSENIMLKAAFGGTFYRITNRFMVEEGYSAQLHAIILCCDQPVHPSLSWSRVYRQAVLSKKRTLLIVDQVIEMVKKGMTVLVLTDQTPHGESICNTLVLKGIDARFMHGGKSAGDRMDARLDFKDRKFPVLVGTTIYDEGVDFPVLDAVVFAGGKKAKGKVLQRLGRGQRKGFHRDGTRKTVATVVDVYDTGHRLLKAHSLRRLLAMYDAGVVMPEEYRRLLVKEGIIDG